MAKAGRRPKALLQVRINPESHYKTVCFWLRVTDIRILEFVCPFLAAIYCLRLFEATRKVKYPSIDATYIKCLEHETFAWGRQSLSVNFCGPTSGPTAILLHGWEGRCSMMRPVAEALAQEGFRVILLDLPAHGRSGGKRASYLELAQSVVKVAEKYKQIDVVVGHSSGGLVGALAILRGLDTRRLVTVGTPKSISDLLDKHASIFGIREPTRAAMERVYLRRYYLTLKTIDSGLFAEIKADVLVCHDEHDTMVPVEDAQVLSRAVQGGRLFLTHGAGHMGILKQQSLHRKIIDFVSEPIQT